MLVLVVLMVAVRVDKLVNAAVKVILVTILAEATVALIPSTISRLLLRPPPLLPLLLLLLRWREEWRVNQQPHTEQKQEQLRQE